VKELKPMDPAAPCRPEQFPVERSAFNCFRGALFLLLVVATSGICCKKHNHPKEDVLPPITQEGKNTFGCRINGKVWVPYYPCFGLPAGAMALSYEIRPFYDTAILPIFFSLRAGNNANGGSGFFIGQNSTISDRIFRPGNIIDSILINFTSNTGHGYYNFDTVPGSSPKEFLITKLDTAKGIVSGTFAFTLYSSPNDSIVFSDGRFDLQFGLYFNCTN
jgi:hypothetical protein